MIRRLNLLYILGFSIVVFFISIYMLNVYYKKQLIEESNIKEVISSGEEYASLNDSWNNKKTTLKTIDNIFSKLKIRDLKKDIKSKKVIIKVDKISSTKLDKLLNKFLNKKLNILKLEMQKDSILLEVGIN